MRNLAVQLGLSRQIDLALTEYWPTVGLLVLVLIFSLVLRIFTRRRSAVGGPFGERLLDGAWFWLFCVWGFNGFLVAWAVIRRIFYYGGGLRNPSQDLAALVFCHLALLVLVVALAMIVRVWSGYPRVNESGRRHPRLAYVSIVGAAAADWFFCGLLMPSLIHPSMIHGEMRLKPDSADFVLVESSQSAYVWDADPYALFWVGPRESSLTRPYPWGPTARLKVQGSNLTVADLGPDGYALQPDHTVVPLRLTMDEMRLLQPALRDYRLFQESPLWQSRVLPHLRRVPPCAEPPQDREALSGDWIGLGREHCLYKFRLMADGSGSALRSCPLALDLQIKRYEVRQWSVTERQLVGGNASPVHGDARFVFQGLACENSLFLRVIEGARGYGNLVRFYRRSAFDQALYPESLAPV